MNRIALTALAVIAIGCTAVAATLPPPGIGDDVVIQSGSFDGPDQSGEVFAFGDYYDRQVYSEYADFVTCFEGQVLFGLDTINGGNPTNIGLNPKHARAEVFHDEHYPNDATAVSSGDEWPAGCVVNYVVTGKIRP